MNLLDPSKMDVVKKSRLAKALNTLSLVSLLGALCASQQLSFSISSIAR